MLHPITGEFRDFEVEREFRISVLESVKRESRLALIIAAALTGMFGISDYNFVGLTPTFYYLIAVRIVMISGCLLLAIVLRSSNALLTRPWLYSVAPVLIASGVILFVALRPETLPTLLTATIVTLLAFYLFIPNLTWGMIGTGFYISAGFLFGIWYWAGLGPVAVLTYGLLLIQANIVGYAVALRIARLQRKQFALLLEERLSKQRLMEEVAHRETLENQLRMMAQTDDLTGLSNRRHFMERAQAALATTRRDERPFSLCMIDIDHFKAINDSWGHACGDRVIRDVAETCTRVLPDGAVVARFGGEEFVAALPGVTIDHARSIAERLRESVAGLHFDGDLAELRVTVTIGISEVLPLDVDFEPALKRADAALYLGKRNGRNVVFSNRIGQDQQKPEAAAANIGEP